MQDHTLALFTTTRRLNTMRMADFRESSLRVLTTAGAASLAVLMIASCSSSSPGGAAASPDGGGAHNDSAVPLNDAGSDPPEVVTTAPGDTGSACTASGDCKGTGASCQNSTTGGLVFPGGYCTATCTTSNNDPNTGLNPACPGFGLCLGSTGACFAACTAKDGQYPCRANYYCFGFTSGDVCFPEAASQCDPTKTGSCPKSDAGGAQTCVQVGPDPVGNCLSGCDFFTQGCAPDAQGAQACYSNIVGEGFCAHPNKGGAEGAACQYINDCNAGFGCHIETQTTAFCRPYCGGAGNKACANGKQCVDFSATVPKTIVGLCGG